ncbi:hypothetical protein IC575_023781 [Cucumis melo]
MSYLLPHLHSGWAVDQAILAEEERVVIIRFGHDWDDTCMQVNLIFQSLTLLLLLLSISLLLCPFCLLIEKPRRKEKKKNCFIVVKLLFSLYSFHF